MAQRFLHLTLIAGVTLLVLLPAPWQAPWAGLTLALALGQTGRLMRALGQGTGSRAGDGAVLLIPPINLIAIVVMNRRATRLLRTHGYRVRLLGAAPRHLPPPLGVPWVPTAATEVRPASRPVVAAPAMPAATGGPRRAGLPLAARVPLS